MDSILSPFPVRSAGAGLLCPGVGCTRCRIRITSREKDRSSRFVSKLGPGRKIYDAAIPRGSTPSPRHLLGSLGALAVAIRCRDRWSRATRQFSQSCSRAATSIPLRTLNRPTGTRKIRAPPPAANLSLTPTSVGSNGAGPVPRKLRLCIPVGLGAAHRPPTRPHEGLAWTQWCVEGDGSCTYIPRTNLVTFRGGPPSSAVHMMFDGVSPPQRSLGGVARLPVPDARRQMPSLLLTKLGGR